MSTTNRSAFRSVAAFTASNPLPHSATISISACSASHSRRMPRASASSSTMTTRILSVCASLISVLDDRNRYTHLNLELPRSFLGANGVSRSELGHQPLPQQLESQADTARANAIGIAGILDRDGQHEAMTARGHPNRASLHKLRDPVNDRILHERLQEQW